MDDSDSFEILIRPSTDMSSSVANRKTHLIREFPVDRLLGPYRPCSLWHSISKRLQKKKHHTTAMVYNRKCSRWADLHQKQPPILPLPPGFLWYQISLLSDYVLLPSNPYVSFLVSGDRILVGGRKCGKGQKRRACTLRITANLRIITTLFLLFYSQHLHGRWFALQHWHGAGNGFGKFWKRGHSQGYEYELA